MKVPFVMLSKYYQAYKEEIDRAFQNVMEEGNYILGKEVARFESNIANFCGSRNAISCANGLDAIYLALEAMGVGQGDEVIVPANTYIATWIAVSRLGAIPVPCEPKPDTYNIDVGRMERLITDKTKAIVPVDLYGLPCDLDDITEVANTYSLKVIVDAAQSFGAKYKGKVTGTGADAVAFSFYPTKPLGAIGDGGCVVTTDKEMADRIRMFRNYGSSAKYVNKYIGINSRLDELQAALLNVKLKHFHETDRARHAVAEFYNEFITNPDVSKPMADGEVRSSWHLYVIRTKRRSELQTWLKEKGIDTIVHYPVPPHMQEAYSFLDFSKGSFPISEQLANEVLSLPIDSFISADQMDFVASSINEFR